MQIRFILLFVGMLFLHLAPVARADSWALLVGVSRYDNPGITPLRFPAADATGIRDALTDPQLGNLPTDHVRLLADDAATAKNITGAVDDFLKAKVQPGDQVIVFLAGHGVTKGVGADAESYFLPSDAKGLTSTALEASAVNLKTLSAKLSQLPASQFVVFVDACRDDPTPGRGIKGNALTDVLSRGLQIIPEDATRPASSVSFFACGVGQRAYEDPKLQHGVFTYWILNGIREAAVPQRPEGTVEMGRLASYVRLKVSEWAKQASGNGNFDIEQTPEIVTTELNGPVILMRVKRNLPQGTVPAAPPALSIYTYPENATVSINGKSIGSAPLTHTLADSGDYTVKVEAAGYQTAEQSVKVLSGYGQQVVVRLQPAPGGVPVDAKTAELYERAMEAETRQQWEAAEAGYEMVVQSNPKFQPAYERLADIRMRQGRFAGGVATLVTMLANVPPNARAFSRLARAYVVMHKEGIGDPTGVGLGLRRGNFEVPRQQKDAGKWAIQAAQRAVQSDPSSPDSQAALGFALVATDSKAKNQQPALAAFGKAVFLNPKDAENHYGMGYAIRSFAQLMPEGGARQAELRRAITSLQQALALRADHYEARREMAYCYHLLDDTQAAMREYEKANAHRGAASNPNEVAATDCALASLHQEEAQKSTGVEKQQHEAASAGYLSDAKENDPDLKESLEILGKVGLGTRVANYLPGELRRFLNLPNNWRNEVGGNIRNRIPRLPF